jgi:hypothetical protein
VLQVVSSSCEESRLSSLHLSLRLPQPQRDVRRCFTKTGERPCQQEGDGRTTFPSGLVPLPLPSLRYSTVLPSPSRYGKRYEVRLYTSRVDEVSEGFDGTQDILTVWTSSMNQA